MKTAYVPMVYETNSRRYSRICPFTLDTRGEHGLKHWGRVNNNGQKLQTHMTPEVHSIVVELFAYLHDSCREDNFEDLHHGERAVEWIKTLRHSYLKDLSDEDFDLQYDACRLHTTSKTGNPTIDACFDADRLDLVRISIQPDPQYMATPCGKYLAEYLPRF